MMLRFLPSSRLHDQNTFYTAFERDLLRAQYEVIIESPFITRRRINNMMPIFARLRGRDVSIVINTRNPKEHSGSYYHQALSAVIEMQELGIKVLYTTGHHRKLAIIDRKVIYEGSLNILSFSDSCEIMRRIVSSTEAVRLLKFIGLTKYVRYK
jgi:phosphatidylserine/phosphatidylglycerophosphate/cardiolipin synthase-like enzyme